MLIHVSSQVRNDQEPWTGKRGRIRTDFMVFGLKRHNMKGLEKPTLSSGGRQQAAGSSATSWLLETTSIGLVRYDILNGVNSFTGPTQLCERSHLGLTNMFYAETFHSSVNYRVTWRHSRIPKAESLHRILRFVRRTSIATRHLHTRCAFLSMLQPLRTTLREKSALQCTRDKSR